MPDKKKNCKLPLKLFEKCELNEKNKHNCDYWKKIFKHCILRKPNIYNSGM